MGTKIPEANKKPGVCYAWTDEDSPLPCMELPVVDVTHPAFAFDCSAEAVNRLIDQFVLSLQRLAQTPAPALQAMLQRSLLMRGMMVDSANTYTTGMMTYLNKLGPDNLGAYAGPIDRQWAASLTPLTFRWRMRDVAELLAGGLAPALASRPGAPLHLINIAGGPAIDSLNALIVLQKEHPGLLGDRPVTIHVFDLDPDGPHFGARALDALLAEGAPLHGLAAELNDHPYDWADPRVLRERIDGFAGQDVVAAGSSEGGLFEYATDAEIQANLETLRQGTPADFFMVGPVVRDAGTLDPRLRSSENVPGRPAIRYLGLERFGALACNAGWEIERSLDGPMHQVVCLKKR